jgi:hypothetical protein
MTWIVPGGEKRVAQHGKLGPKPLGPSEVTLAGTPGAVLRLPPNPKEVTEAGTPFDWAAQTLAVAADNRTTMTTDAGFIRA